MPTISTLTSGTCTGACAVLGTLWRCWALHSPYGALLLVDLEDEFFPQEVEKLKMDVEERGLSVVGVASVTWGSHSYDATGCVC